MNPRQLNLVLVCVVILCCAVSVAGQSSTREWSQPVNGVQGRIIVSDDVWLYGTQMTTVDLELRNVSDVGNPIAIYFDPNRSFKCELLDAKDQAVARPPFAADIITPNPYWLSLPYQGTLRWRVSVSGYGIKPNSGKMVQMSCGMWLIKPGDHSEYGLAVKFVAVSTPEDRERRAWTGTLTIPKAPIPR
jgi:hypothetical protein